jgi:hypothetical protein
MPPSQTHDLINQRKRTPNAPLNPSLPKLRPIIPLTTDQIALQDSTSLLLDLVALCPILSDCLDVVFQLCVSLLLAIELVLHRPELRGIVVFKILNVVDVEGFFCVENGVESVFEVLYLLGVGLVKHDDMLCVRLIHLCLLGLDGVQEFVE